MTEGGIFLIVNLIEPLGKFRYFVHKIKGSVVDFKMELRCL